MLAFLPWLLRDLHRPEYVEYKAAHAHNGELELHAGQTGRCAAAPPPGARPGPPEPRPACSSAGTSSGGRSSLALAPQAP